MTANLRNGPALSKKEFFIAMKLVALAQAGGAVTREAVIAAGAGPGFPRFEGLPAPAPAPAASPFAITPADQAKYDSVFAQTDADGDGFVSGGDAVALFLKSGLERPVLKAIWDMADMDRDARLDREEFSIAMHLVVGISKRGLALPHALPIELTPASRRQRGLSGGAPAPAPAPAPVVFTPATLDDAFGALPVPAPATVAPVLHSAPTPTLTGSSGAGALPMQASESPAMAARPPLAPHGSASPLAGAPPTSAPAPAPAPMRRASGSSGVPPSASSTPAFTTEDASSLVKPIAAAATELEGAMASHVRREGGALDARKALTEAAGAELKRLEGERNVFAGQLARLKASCEKEDAEFAALMASAASLRAELAHVRAAEAEAAAALAARRSRTGEAKGMVATLAAALVAAGGRRDALSGEAAALLEAACGAELAAARNATTTATVAGISAVHSAANEANEADIAALRAAVAATTAAADEAAGRVSALRSRSVAAQAGLAASEAELTGAQAELVSSRSTHESRYVR